MLGFAYLVAAIEGITKGVEQSEDVRRQKQKPHIERQLHPLVGIRKSLPQSEHMGWCCYLGSFRGFGMSPQEAYLKFDRQRRDFSIRKKKQARTGGIWG